MEKWVDYGCLGSVPFMKKLLWVISSELTASRAIISRSTADVKRKVTLFQGCSHSMTELEEGTRAGSVLPSMILINGKYFSGGYPMAWLRCSHRTMAVGALPTQTPFFRSLLPQMPDPICGMQALLHLSASSPHSPSEVFPSDKFLINLILSWHPILGFPKQLKTTLRSKTFLKSHKNLVCIKCSCFSVELFDHRGKSKDNLYTLESSYSENP